MCVNRKVTGSSATALAIPAEVLSASTRRKRTGAVTPTDGPKLQVNRARNFAAASKIIVLC